MCGIAGVHIKNPKSVPTDKEHDLLERFCNLLLLGIENRGRDATGFVAVTHDRKTVLHKDDVPAQEFVESRKAFPLGTQSVLLHTRFATKGHQSVWANNHPVFSGNGGTFTVHNGTISNDNLLFKEHDFNRLAEVDSEIIPALLNKHTFDHPEKAFAELTGGFSTASVNPIDYPGVVILGKGGSWPLVVFEAKEFVVWASTKEAIRDAWGATLGTPPSKGYEELNSGDIWILNKDLVDKHPKAFEHRGRWASNSSSTTTQTNSYADDWEDYDWSDEAQANWWNGFPHRGGGMGRQARVVLDYSEIIAEHAKHGRTAAVTMLDKHKPTAKRYLEKFGNGKWQYCVHCKRTVSDVQVMKGVAEWGNICVDCFALASSASSQGRAQTGLEAYLVDIGLRSDDFAQIKRFADLQTYIHHQALYAVSNATGVPKNVVDFLVHRAEVVYLETSDELTKLYADLTDRYLDALSELWQEWIVKDEKAQKQDKDDAEMTSSAWVVCASGTHKTDEPCDACTDTSGEYGSCGVRAFEEPKDEDSQVISDTAAPKTCMYGRCGRKPKHYLGTTHAWCNKHFDKCVTRGCKAKAIGYREDNFRLCHVHSRGVRGFTADGDYNARKRRIRRERRNAVL